MGVFRHISFYVHDSGHNLRTRQRVCPSSLLRFRPSYPKCGTSLRAAKRRPLTCLVERLRCGSYQQKNCQCQEMAVTQVGKLKMQFNNPAVNTVDAVNTEHTTTRDFLGLLLGFS